VRLSLREYNPDVQKFVPRIISWNTTLNCNLSCAHCYVDASDRAKGRELNTDEGKRIIDHIVEVSKPILVLSGGEPLLRQDILELADYGAKRGLKVVMGTNGTLINEEVGRKLKSVGVSRVGISLDSISPEKHDSFRGVKGAWKATMRGIQACRRVDLSFQIQTTVTPDNYDEIEGIVALSQQLGASDFHLFFLVPIGRAEMSWDITPDMYEDMISKVLELREKYAVEVKPTCAPQYTRIARQKGIPLNRWGRGCIAGLNYCRICATGEVTPCPYLPIKVGDLRESSFKKIWLNSEVLSRLRDFGNLKGKCGICEYRDVCGGCRARAYGLTSSFTGACGGSAPPSEINGDYLAEDPMCIHQPKQLG